MNRFFCSSFLLVASAFSLIAAEDEGGVSGGAVVREMNLARQNPAAYAEYLEDLRAHYDGRCVVLPEHTKIFTKEGTRAVDDAIRFLRSTSPVQPLILSAGMCKGAADHCADQAGGGFSHSGRNGSNPGGRMNRYGNWSASWGENIAYGKRSARDIVIALIIDDGQPARKHRKNIFNSGFNFAGAAYGPHARFGSVCTTDFAGAYAERGQGTLMARNF